MKGAPGKSPAASMLAVAVTMRLYWGIAADRPFVPNAAWLCPLAGLVIFLPFCFAINRAEKIGNDCAWGNLANTAPKIAVKAGEIIFSLLLLYDCAVTMRLLANTANVMSLNQVSTILLLIPLAALVAANVLAGADALGSSARLWLRFMPFLFAVVFIVQVRVYNPSWLTPILGSGIGDIADGGVYSAGCMALLSLSWMLAVPDRNKKPLILYITLSVLAAALLLAAWQMLTPPVFGHGLSRTSRIKLILSNGRSALSLQMLLLVLWYGANLHLIGAEAVSAACCLKRLIPSMPQWVLALGEALLAIVAASSALTSEAPGQRLYPWLYVLLSGILALVMLSCLFKKGGKTCES